MDPGPHVPKQAITKDVDLYAEITQNSTRDVCRKVLELLPSFTKPLVIHDNGCGLGEVTGMIMESHPLQGTKIHATDIDQSYLDRFQALATAQKWPVEISNMAAESQTFADSIFDLSIANFLIFLTPEGGIPTLRQMHRTLKPGGATVFTAWARLPHVDCVKAAHAGTRGTDAPPLREIPAEWWLGSTLERAAVDAGFSKGKMKLRTVKVYISADNVEHLARVMWSYLGPPVTGWLVEDEENWDKAVEIILRSFGEVEGFEALETGGMKIELTGNVLIARK